MLRLLKNINFIYVYSWLSNFCQRWCSLRCLSFIVYILGVVGCIIFASNFFVVFCDDFFVRQHTTRVEIIKDLILNSTEKDVSIAIQKCLKVKAACISEFSGNTIITDSSSMTPLQSSNTFGEFFKRFSFWFFMVILSLFFDGLLTFTSFLFNDVSSLQQINLSLFHKIQENPELVEDLYDIFVKLKLL